MQAEPVRLQKVYNYHVYSSPKNPFKSFLQKQFFQQAIFYFYLVSGSLSLKKYITYTLIRFKKWGCLIFLEQSRVLKQDQP